MSHDTPRHSIILLAVLVGIASVFGKFIISILPPFPIISDSLSYITIAEGIIQGSYPAIDGIFYSPGYPIFLSGIFSWFGDQADLVYQAQFALLGVLAFLTYYIARHHLKVSVLLAGLAAILIMLWPYMILYSLLIMGEIVYTTVLLAASLFTILAVTTERLRWFVISGLAFGLAALIKPVALLLPVWLLVLGVLYSLLGTYRLPPAKHIVLGLCTFALILSPWFTFKSTATLPEGTTTPQSSFVFEKSFTTLSYQEDRDLSQPVTITDIVTSKIANFFLFWNPGAGGYQAEQLTSKFPSADYAIMLYKIGFFLLLILALAPLFTIPSRSLLVLWSIIGYVWLLHTILFPYPRYTLPIIPLMLISAMVGLGNWKEIVARLLGRNHNSSKITQAVRKLPGSIDIPTKRILVFIPAKNESTTISEVVTSCRKVIKEHYRLTPDILVISDGSTDDTVKNARNSGAVVIDHATSRGLGTIFQEAVMYTIDHTYDYLVTIDGDKQFDETEIPYLLHPIITNQADFCSGNRFSENKTIPHMSQTKRIGNSIVSRLVNYILNSSYTDVSCGFRAYSREALLHLNLFGGFTYTQEVFLNLGFKGLRIQEVPISVTYFPKRSSRIAYSVMRYGFQVLKIILSSLIFYKPLKFFGTFTILLWGFALPTIVILGVRYLVTGLITPYKALGILAVGSFGIGIILLTVGVILYALSKQQLSIDKVLYYAKQR